MALDQVLFGKIISSLCLTMLGVAWASLSEGRKGERFSSFAVKVCSVFLAVRFGAFLFLFVLLEFVAQSDIIDYFNWATLINDGAVPGQTERVPLHYGPLFLYIINLL